MRWPRCLIVLGPQEGLAFAERHALPALFVVRTDDGLQTRASQAWPRTGT